MMQPNTRRITVTRLFLFLTLISTIAIDVVADETANAANEQPNFIFFITDDISPADLGCYGSKVVKTPHLDEIAKQGLVFENAYLTISSCSPSRCSMITCRYPHNMGAPELHTSLPEGQPLFPLALKEKGYYTVLSGKHHMGKNANKAFDKISGGKGPSRSEDWVEILASRPQDKPFFAWFASSDAHRGWAFNEQAPHYADEDAVVPPYLVDGPATRNDLASYYHEVSRTDYFSGELIKELKRQGIADNTYFIYCSDNGRPFPRCKTYLYDDGIKTPLIVWSPGNVQPGRSKSLVSAIDIGTTILELAGVERDERMQGVSFAATLNDHENVTRDYVFAEHNWHVYQNHERLVRHGDWVYIRNAWPERRVLCSESHDEFASGKELWQAFDEGGLHADQKQIVRQPAVAEQLFNVTADPYQLTNLANQKDSAEVLAQLRKVLNEWTEQTGDTVPENPTNDRYTGPRPQANGKHGRDPNHKRGEFPGAARNATKINHPGPVRASK
jgi:N-sulfoglucosamine sulfohydrolase